MPHSHGAVNYQPDEPVQAGFNSLSSSVEGRTWGTPTPTLGSFRPRSACCGRIAEASGVWEWSVNVVSAAGGHLHLSEDSRLVQDVQGPVTWSGIPDLWDTMGCLLVTLFSEILSRDTFLPSHEPQSQLPGSGWLRG